MAPTSAQPPVLAPGVSLTNLPFGGAVLVHGATLALVECDGRDARLLAGLLAGAVQPDTLPAADSRDAAPPDGTADTSDRAAAVQLLRQLAADGWLVVPPTRTEDT